MQETIELSAVRHRAHVMSAVDYQSVEPSLASRILGSSWVRGMTGWHFVSPHWLCTSAGVAQLYWHNGSHAGHLFSRRVQAVSERFLGASVRKAAADCTGDLFGITNEKVDPGLALGGDIRTVGPLIVSAPRMSPAASKTGAERPDAESSRSPAVIA